MKRIKVNLISLGCSKNLVDSEKLLAQLPREHFDILHDSNQASEVVIINTCGFIQDAKQESIDTILSCIQARKNGKIRQLIVMGCLSQRYRDELQSEIPEVDAWFGVSDHAALLSYLKQKPLNDQTKRYLTTPGHYAYLKIAEGCNRTCSFCAIPMIRGSFKSVEPDLLLKEAGLLAAQGVRELLLIAQDLSYYGYDLSGKTMLPGLLDSLSDISGIEWIRLHYAYPSKFPLEILSQMQENPKICRYLDMPLQHISDSLLKRMRRGHSEKQLRNLISTIRSKVPGIALRTTMLVGFPGETDADFSRLMDFVGEARFERLGVFTYSPEEGTAAWDYSDNVPEEIKKFRAESLMELQQRISLENNQSKIGEKMRVLIDRSEGDYGSGRTEFDSPEVDNEVMVKSTESISAGNFIEVRITGASDFELYAEACRG